MNIAMEQTEVIPPPLLISARMHMHMCASHSNSLGGMMTTGCSLTAQLVIATASAWPRVHNAAVTHASCGAAYRARAHCDGAPPSPLAPVHFRAVCVRVTPPGPCKLLQGDQHPCATVQEYVNGQLKNHYGDAFIRGNNGAPPPPSPTPPPPPWGPQGPHTASPAHIYAADARISQCTHRSSCSPASLNRQI